MSEETQSRRQQVSFARKCGSVLAILTIGFVAVVTWLWCIGFAYCLDDNLPNWLAKFLALDIALSIPILFFLFRKTKPLIPAIGLCLVLVICWFGFKLMNPTHDREWGIAQQTLPFAEFDSENPLNSRTVTVRNIRANRYGPVESAGASHYDDTFDLSKLNSVWFGVDRFTDVKPLAHTFMSFGFEPGMHRTNYLAFSVETRREKDENLYSPVRGLFNNYEVIYVVADEQDVLSVRSDVQEHVVQLYPVRATKEQAKSMFLDMLNRTNAIREQPEFYHTLTSNCTNNIVYHTNKVLDEPISLWERGVIFPGYSDWLAYRRGIINTELPLEEAREAFRIDQRVKDFDGKSDFSEFIREK